MKILKKILCLFFVVISGALNAQVLQTVRGKVSDADSRYPLFGARIVVLRDSSLLGGAFTDDAGKFSVAGISVGKVSVRCSLVGYATRQLDNVEVTAAHEVVLDILLEELAITLDEVEIKAQREGEVKNEMALISARQFTVEETNRYAGSRGDPARMVSNFAGVQGADDSRNDVVIRGNSPQGVSWRMEGVEIFNPNHFAIPGTAGGPLSIINNRYLANSDFFTGAFPAEYGNSVAGVFDLRMRNGNNERHEFSAQLGFLGTEVFAEGPLSKKTGSSYLASYRYSTLDLFQFMGIKIGTDAVPRYQDGAFRIVMPGKKNNSLSIWALGGGSAIDIMISEQKTPDQINIYGMNDRDQYYKTRMGIGGVTYTESINEKSFLKVTLAAATNRQNSYHELVYRHLDSDLQFVVDSLSPLQDYTFNESKLTASVLYNHKWGPRHLLRAGVHADQYFWHMLDTVRVFDTTSTQFNQWTYRWNARSNAQFIQPFVQYRYRPGENWTITMGIHAAHFTFNGSTSPFEPRLGARYKISRSQALSFGAGRHSQLQPTYMYFYNPGIGNQVTRYDQTLNGDLSFTMSDQAVLGHEAASGAWYFKTEVYYQRLFNVPIEVEPSSFSLVNTGAGFSRFFPRKLRNEGTARNTGIEFTAGRHYSKGWLFLFTAALFDSQYKGSDMVERYTDFNGRYAANVLASKEWQVRKHNALILGTKLTRVGGRWYGPADEAASALQREVVFVDSLRNTLQFEPYFRWDIKINYRINLPRLTHELGLDLVNVLNTRNVLKLTYAPDDVAGNAIRKEYQLGFLPIFYWRVDW